MKHTLTINETEIGKDGLLVFTGDVTIASAGQVKDVLLSAVKEVARLNIDLTGVEATDISFLQILCAAHRQMSMEDKQICLSGGMSGVIENMLHRTGYKKKIGCSNESMSSCLWIDSCG